MYKDPVDIGETSDGYHTFNELYDHRMVLYIALCKTLVLARDSQDMYEREAPTIKYDVWASTKHSDGSSWEDWFIMGIGKEKGKQMTYHLPAKYWNEVCEFAEILDKAPEFDGHTPENVLERLKEL